MAQWLIVGLGNPGKRYENTRHNIGFMVVEMLARAWGLSWKEESRFSGRLAKGVVGGDSLILLEPMTYMNLSGQALQKVLNFFKWTASTVLVVVDDIAIPFGEMRLKEKGSPGGHNGLKSIQAHLGTQEYLRLRMGVGERAQGTLTSHVLGCFDQDESEELPAFIQRGQRFLQRLVEGEDLRALMKEINTRPKAPEKRPAGTPSTAPTTLGDIAFGTTGPTASREVKGHLRSGKHNEEKTHE